MKTLRGLLEQRFGRDTADQLVETVAEWLVSDEAKHAMWLGMSYADGRIVDNTAATLAQLARQGAARD